jgi:hypothetical protein
MCKHILVRTAVIAGLALAMAACGTKSGESSAPTTPTGPTTPAASPTSPTAEPLAATGLGPYAVGTKLAALKSTGVLADLDEEIGCPGWALAKGTGAYAGAVSLIFYNGAISWVEVHTPAIPTVDNAKVGMTLAEIKATYGSKATEFTNTVGLKALSVHEGAGLGLFFRFDEAGKATVIEAGQYNTLEFRFNEGEGC